MSVLKKAICALALVGVVTVPVNSNAQVVETGVGLFGGLSAGGIVLVIGGIVALGALAVQASDDGKSG